MRRRLLPVVALLGLVAPSAHAQAPDFARDVLPILQANCFKCHGDGKVKGKLSLFTRAAIFKGGNSGPPISLDRPNDSLLLKAINHQGDLKMPPEKLSQRDIDALTRWVKDGAAWPDGVVATMPS